MDPIVMLAIIRDGSADLIDRVQALVDLDNWILSGGWVPGPETDDWNSIAAVRPTLTLIRLVIENV